MKKHGKLKEIWVAVDWIHDLWEVVELLRKKQTITSFLEGIQWRREDQFGETRISRVGK